MVLDVGAVSAVDYSVYRCASGNDRADGLWVAKMMDAVDYDADMGGLFSPDYVAFCPTCRRRCFSKGAKEGQGNGN